MRVKLTCLCPLSIGYLHRAICSLQGNYHSPAGCLSVYKPGRSQSQCAHLQSFFLITLRCVIRVKMSHDIYSDLLSATVRPQPL